MNADPMEARDAAPATREPRTSHEVPAELAFHDRSGTIYGWIAALLASGGLLFFWVMGAIDLLTGEGGLILQLRLEGIWRMLFLAYPFVFVIALVLGAVLVALRRDFESIAAVGAPVVLALLYYFALLYLRPI